MFNGLRLSRIAAQKKGTHTRCNRLKKKNCCKNAEVQSIPIRLSFIHCKDKKNHSTQKTPTPTHPHIHTHVHRYTQGVCVCVCVCERERERASQAYIREVEKAEDEAQERKGPRDDEEYVRDECHNVAIAYCTVVVDECATGQHQYRHGWPSPHYHITSCTHFICSLSLSLSLPFSQFSTLVLVLLLLLLLQGLVLQSTASVTPPTSSRNSSAIFLSIYLSACIQNESAPETHRQKNLL
jgi:hypothetical protein